MDRVLASGPTESLDVIVEAVHGRVTIVRTELDGERVVGTSYRVA